MQKYGKRSAAVFACAAHASCAARNGPFRPEWPDAPAQPIQYDVPAMFPRPEPAEPVTQPAPQGKPVVFSLEPELPAQPQWTNRYCPHCGAPVKLSDAVFCTVCGKSLS